MYVKILYYFSFGHMGNGSKRVTVVKSFDIILYYVIVLFL